MLLLKLYTSFSFNGAFTDAKFMHTQALFKHCECWLFNSVVIAGQMDHLVFGIFALLSLFFCRFISTFFLMSWWYSRFNIWFSFFVLIMVTHHPETLVCHLAPSDYTMSNYRAKWKTPVKPASCAALNLFWLTVTKNITKRAFGQFGERLPDHKQPQLQSHLQTRLNTVLMKSYVFFVTHTSTRMNSNRLKVLESISMTLRPQVQEPHFSLNYQISLGFV